jgi:CHAT domain-containing protein
VKWKKEHPEKNCAYSNKYYHQMKEESPEKYQEYLAKQKEYYKHVKDSPEIVAKRKEYYQNVIKPRKTLLKQQSVTPII